MKYLSILLLIFIPCVTFAQSHKELKKQYEQRKIQLYQQRQNFERNPNLSIPNAGVNLQKSATLSNAGLVLSVLGGGVMALSATVNDGSQDAVIIAGAGTSVIGLVLQVIANNKIRRAGEYLERSRISFSGKGLSYSF